VAYISLAEAKAYLDVAALTDDALISDLIDEAQAWLEQETGRVFEAATESRYYDATLDAENGELWLDKDLWSVTSITSNDGTTYTTSDYVLHPVNDRPYYMIKIRSDSTRAWDYDDYPEKAITVTGRWGYSSSAPVDVQLAIKELVSYLYHERSSHTFDVQVMPGEGVMVVPQGFPRRALRTVQRYRRYSLI